MWQNKGKVAIVGVGASELTRKPTKALGSYTLEACQKAVEDAGLPLSAIDGLASFPEAPFIGAGTADGEHVVTPIFLLNHIIVEGKPLADKVRWYSQQEQGMILAALVESCNALIAGACNYVLLWRAMYIPRGAYGEVAIPTGRVGGEWAFKVPYGFVSSFQNHAVMYRRYMDLYGAKREHMATLAVSERKFANKNDKAIFHKTPLSKEDYMKARMIADPLCLYDCDIPVEGAMAVVLTTADRARDLRHPPAYVASYGLNTCRKLPLIAYTLENYMDNPCGRQIFQASGYTPKDVDIALIYDGYLASVWYGLEAYGFCKQGEGFEFIQGGRIEQDGELPINTNGGACSEGRLHGMGHLIEGVLQVTGRAGARQVKKANSAFVSTGSPMLRNSAVLLTKES